MKSALSNWQRTSLDAGDIDRVNDTLRGPVVDIFLTHVPAFQGLTRQQAFDTIMNNPALAEECFKLFRKMPQLFDKIVVDINGRTVGHEDQRLACGRTLADVIALIVRAVAKRHFYTRLAPARPIAAAAQPPSAWRRMMARLRLASPPPKPRRKATRADSLYRALRDFLLYEWQLPLIPHYVPLPVSVVRQLGPRILEYRQPQQLKALLLEGLPPNVDRASSPSSAPAEPPEVGTSKAGEPGSRPRTGRPGLNAEAMWKASQTLELTSLFKIDEQEMRRTIAHASAASGQVLAAFAKAGLKLRETVVVLCTIDRLVGHAHLAVMLGPSAAPRLLSAITEQFRREGVAAMRDPADIRQATLRILVEFRKNGLIRS